MVEHMIGFSEEEFDEILKYQEVLGTDTIQSAVMNAIRNVMDKETEDHHCGRCGPTMAGDGEDCPFYGRK